MADQDGPLVEPLFRAHKRRKILRRRDDAETDSDAPLVQQRHIGANHEEGDTSVRPTQRKHVVRKHGIAYTSTGRSQSQQQQAQELQRNDEMAVMSVHASREQNVLPTVSTERFVKPTGKAAVVDDKHMYVGKMKATMMVKQH